MTPTPFGFRRATAWADLPALLAPVGAMPVAGAQSLMPLLALRLAEPTCLVALDALPGFRDVRWDAAQLHLGAGVTHAMIEDGVGPEPLRGWLGRVAAGIAYRPVRNRGTVGGSLALHDPAADWPVALLALDAAVVLRRGEATRRLHLAAFLTGAFATALQPAEVIAGIEIPLPPAGTRFGWCKLAPSPGAYAEAAAAMCGTRRAVATPHGARLLPDAPPAEDAHLARLRDVALRRAAA